MDNLKTYNRILNDTWHLLKKFLTMERPEFGSDEYFAALITEASDMGTKYGTDFATKQAALVINELDRIWREERNERI